MNDIARHRPLTSQKIVAVLRKSGLVRGKYFSSPEHVVVKSDLGRHPDESDIVVTLRAYQPYSGAYRRSAEQEAVEDAKIEASRVSVRTRFLEAIRAANIVVVEERTGDSLVLRFGPSERLACRSCKGAGDIEKYAHCLKCYGGWIWVDSPRDLAKGVGT